MNDFNQMWLKFYRKFDQQVGTIDVVNFKSDYFNENSLMPDPRYKQYYIDYAVIWASPFKKESQITVKMWNSLKYCDCFF